MQCYNNSLTCASVFDADFGNDAAVARLVALLDEPEPVVSAPAVPSFRLAPAKIDTIKIRVVLKRPSKLQALLSECRASLGLPDSSNAVGLDAGDPDAIQAGLGCSGWLLRVEDPTISGLRGLLLALDARWGVDAFEIDGIDVAVDAFLTGAKSNSASGQAAQHAQLRLFLRNRLMPAKGFCRTWRAVASRKDEPEPEPDIQAWIQRQQAMMDRAKRGEVVFDELPKGTSYLGVLPENPFAEISLYHKTLDQKRVLADCAVCSRLELSISQDALCAAGLFGLRTLDHLERFDFRRFKRFFEFRQTDDCASLPVATQLQMGNAPAVKMSRLNDRFRDALAKLKLS